MGGGPVRGRGPPTRALFTENVCKNARTGSHGGGGMDPLGGHGPPMRALFTKNECENERIGSRRGGHAPGTPPRSANATN